MTWQIIKNWIESFTPAIEKVNEIWLEMVNYIVYIWIAVLWITIIYYGVKMIIRYIQDNILYKTRNRNQRKKRNRKKRKHTRTFENTYDNFF